MQEVKRRLAFFKWLNLDKVNYLLVLKFLGKEEHASPSSGKIIESLKVLNFQDSILYSTQLQISLQLKKSGEQSLKITFFPLARTLEQLETGYEL